MRKYFHIFLVFSLLFSTAGYAVTRHICGEVLAHVDLGHKASSCCESQGLDDCECENETEHVVLEDEYQSQQQQIKLSPSFQATLLSFLKFLAFAPIAENTKEKLHPHLKFPPLTGPDIHIRVQSFLL